MCESIYAYEGGLDSEVVILGINAPVTVEIAGIVGVKDFGVYNQIDGMIYDENYNPLPPSGIQYRISEGGESEVYLATLYIVPTIVYEPGSGGGSGMDSSLATVISIIPLIMAVGLVLATITVWKRQ